MSGPTWSQVDDETSDLLALVADTNHVSTDYEWRLFLDALEQVAQADDVVSQNDMRPLIADKIAPRRIGSFYSRAVREGLIHVLPDTWEQSTDTKGGNRGKPCRIYGYDRTAGDAA